MQHLNNHKEILSCLRDSRKHPEKMNVDFKDKACSKDISLWLDNALRESRKANSSSTIRDSRIAQESLRDSRHHLSESHKKILSSLRESRNHPEKMRDDFKDKACSKDICATMPRLKNDWSDANTRYEYQEGHNIPLPPNLEEFLVILMETQNYLEAGRWQKIRPLQAWQHTRHLQNQGYIRSFHIYPAREGSKCH